MTSRICNAAIGFAVGIFTLPLAAAAWPFVAAWFMWHETDEDLEAERCGGRGNERHCRP